MRFLKTSLLLLFIGVVVIFIIQNLETVRVSFLSWHLELPLSIISVIVYILGALSGGLLFSLLKKAINNGK